MIPTRSSIITNGIPADTVPDLYRAENVTLDELWKKTQQLTRDTYPHDEIFGEYCHTAQYIACPVDMAFEYASNPFCVEEFTFSLRDLKYLGGNMYQGKELIVPDTTIYFTVESHASARVVDHYCAWDQGDELWMRYHFRFLDAMKTIRRPGTIVLWTNCKHDYYDRKIVNVPGYISEPRERKDRLWVGDIWPNFYTIHKIEAGNMKRILERRFRSARAPG
jgi:hypothetical protein